MDIIQKEEDKLFMLKEMKDNFWETETDESSSYEEVEEEYKELKARLDASEDDMYPNGRDYEAENFDE